MSEPIRSISEGTFVIGDTNGLTFEAGPGISVSQPSEGTVRIGNDETVLWSGMHDTGTLSETPANFDRIKCYCKDDSNHSYIIELTNEYPKGGNSTSIANDGGWPSIRTLQVELSGTNNTTFTLYAQQFSLASGTTIGWANTYVRGGNGYAKVYKIVGINRISGGNNE